ncbi:MAG: hypothetical protein ACI4VP_06745 [Clostridia bacterium]
MIIRGIIISYVTLIGAKLKSKYKKWEISKKGGTADGNNKTFRPCILFLYRYERLLFFILDLTSAKSRQGLYILNYSALPTGAVTRLSPLTAHGGPHGTLRF